MKKILVLSFVLSVGFISCEKTEKDNFSINADEPSEDVNSSSVSGKHISEISDKNLDNLHQEVGKFYSLLKEMYVDEKISSEVNSAIYVGYYSDENILPSDLINPEQSKVNRNGRVSISLL